MRLDELYTRLNHLAFIENYYVTTKEWEGESFRVLKIYDDDSKLAEVNLDQPYMLRTSFQGFNNRQILEKQALLKLLVDFTMTPVDQRQSDLYYAYYYDLSNITHFIKRLANNRLADDMIPMAYFRTLSDDEKQKYVFNSAEFDDFPTDYKPRFTPDSFVKVMSLEEMEESLEERFPAGPLDD
ncbi:hypothetical protein [Aerococcus sanguinicola]|uniref:hypothetical protein n=1 Tax=Aerococcus sanguinicola TaxID=119206 RepID=UPI0018A76933|nr:hypothetical protein [Aerococcus sanguinicola]